MGRNISTGILLQIDTIKRSFAGWMWKWDSKSDQQGVFKTFHRCYASEMIGAKDDDGKCGGSGKMSFLLPNRISSQFYRALTPISFTQFTLIWWLRVDTFTAPFTSANMFMISNGRNALLSMPYISITSFSFSLPSILLWWECDLRDDGWKMNFNSARLFGIPSVWFWCYTSLL